MLSSANEQLDKALAAYQKDLRRPGCIAANEELLKKEIQLNQILNAYTEFQLDAFAQRLDSALKTMNSHDFYLSYFAGLKYFYNHHFQEALDLWESLPEKEPISRWIEIAFDEIISPRIMSYHSLQCHIELGHLNYLRELIENNSKLDEILDPFESTFLKGLAYSKLAENSSVEIALAYYKQSNALFNTLSNEISQRHCEKKRLCQLYKQMVLDILHKNSTEMIGALAYRMEKWNANAEIQEIAEHCMTFLNNRSQTFSDSLLSNYLQRAFSKTPSPKVMKMI